jgi:hypothetical protein
MSVQGANAVSATETNTNINPLGELVMFRLLFIARPSLSPEINDDVTYISS